MNANLIIQLVQIAISLAQSQVDSGSAKNTLLDIVRTGVQAYEAHTGEPIDLTQIRAEEPL